MFDTTRRSPRPPRRPTLRRLLAGALTRAGFDVTATTDGHKALSEIRSLAYDLLGDGSEHAFPGETGAAPGGASDS